MIKIFIEAQKKQTSEYHFMDDYIDSVLGISKEEYEIVPANGWTNLRNLSSAFKLNTIQGFKNLIIFDADRPDNGGGFEKRKDEIITIIKEMGVEAELFLFPNNRDDGMFEDLLKNIMVHDNHERFFDCYRDYTSCLGDDYIHPNLKGEVFTYISSMKSLPNKVRRNLGSGDWQFTNKEYWNLESDYLLPLKSFILTCFSAGGVSAGKGFMPFHK